MANFTPSLPLPVHWSPLPPPPLPWLPPLPSPISWWDIHGKAFIEYGLALSAIVVVVVTSVWAVCVWFWIKLKPRMEVHGERELRNLQRSRLWPMLNSQSHTMCVLPFLCSLLMRADASVMCALYVGDHTCPLSNFMVPPWRSQSIGA